MKPSERDRGMAAATFDLYLHGKPALVVIAEALATARLEGVRAGIEAAAKVCGPYRDQWSPDTDGPTEGGDTAHSIEKAIRALDAEKVAEGER